MNEIPQLEEETLSIITLIHLLDVRALFNRENERMITIDYKTFSRSPEKKGECIGGGGQSPVSVCYVGTPKLLLIPYIMLTAVVCYSIFDWR